MKARVYWLTAPRTLELQDEEFGSRPLAPHEVEAVTVYTAISPGTELAAWSGKPPLRPSDPYPRLVGYCNLGRVARIGTDVVGIKEGDHVLTHQSHRSAFRVPATEVLLVTRERADEALRSLTTTYLYHLGYAALLAGGYVPGYEVAVVGLGALGFTTASLVTALGGHPVALTGRDGSLQGAAASGMRVAPKALPLPRDVTPPEDVGGFDLVVNTSDAWSDYFLCLEITRKGGTVVLVSFPGRGQPPSNENPLASRLLYDKQLTVRHAGRVSELDAPAIDVRFTLKRNLRYLSALIEGGRVDPTPLVRLSAGWRDLGEVYERLTIKQAGVYSALLEWLP